MQATTLVPIMAELICGSAPGTPKWNLVVSEGIASHGPSLVARCARL